MASFATELFAHFVYSPELSYHDLLAREGSLKTFVTQVLDECGGEFAHFEALSDTLRAQCVFTQHDEELFHEICEKLAPAMDADVEGRLLFVSKELDFLHIYALSNGSWEESCINLPMAGPLGRALMEEKGRA